MYYEVTILYKDGDTYMVKLPDNMSAGSLVAEMFTKEGVVEVNVKISEQDIPDILIQEDNGMMH